MLPPLWAAFFSILFLLVLSPSVCPPPHPMPAKTLPWFSVHSSKLPVSSGNYLTIFSIHYFSISVSLSSLPSLSPQNLVDKDRPVNRDWLFILWLSALHLPCRHLWSQDMWQLSPVVHEPISDLRSIFLYFNSIIMCLFLDVILGLPISLFRSFYSMFWKNQKQTFWPTQIETETAYI